MFKMPPREKVHEALSAVADNRITINGNTADVCSSDESKRYFVEWNNNVYSSNDNATYWRGYVGYPIIGVLMLQGRIKFDEGILKYFKNINWKEINKSFKNDYSKSVESIYEKLKKEGVDTLYIDNEITNIYMALSQLDISIKKGSKNNQRKYHTI
jgi:hypothetical protein